MYVYVKMSVHSLGLACYTATYGADSTTIHFLPQNCFIHIFMNVIYETGMISFAFAKVSLLYLLVKLV